MNLMNLTKLNVFIVYQTVEAGRRAFELFSRLERNLADKCALECNLSNTAILADRAVADLVLGQIRDATLIILALDPQEQISAHVKNWFGQWSFKDSDKRLLVALGSASTEQMDWSVYLAQRHGMDLLTEDPAKSSEDLNTLSEIAPPNAVTDERTRLAVWNRINPLLGRVA